MSPGALTIYNASAGSGKTYKLTEIYLSFLFRSRYNYRRILAVTFTNKATAEMKSRILDNLYRLSIGENCDHLQVLLKAGHSEEWVRKEAGEILDCILHDFSRFSVTTIDSFFQKVIRAFAREAGLHGGYSVELDHELLLSAAVEEMISSASENQGLKKWLASFAFANIDDEKSWDIRGSSMKLAQELFSEKFKILSRDELAKMADKDLLSGYIEKLKSIRSDFERTLTGYGKKATSLISEYEVTDEMFYQKGRGVPGYVRLLARGVVTDANCYVREILADTPRWSTGAIPGRLQQAISAGLGVIMRESIFFYDAGVKQYNTACAILSNIYALGILTDVLYHVRDLTSMNNRFLLSDAGELLFRIIAGDQCPFIYEKIGNKYDHFMIDEFQDTSIIQWNNFYPLILNSMSQGYANLVVGDVKQSIYRWRNSDWTILGKMPEENAGNDRIICESLTTNWRSSEAVIRFNNAAFTIIPSILDERLEEDSLPVKFSRIYSEAIQKDPGKNKGGYVRFEFLESEEQVSWQGKVLERLPGLLRMLYDRGYSASDIGIIVRESREGAMVLRTLIEHSGPADSGNYCNFSFVSDDSLLLSGSAAINFIISALYVVNDPADMISRAAMFRYFFAARNDKSPDDVVPGSPDAGELLPAGYSGFLSSLINMPLFEATERIAGFFGLGDYSWNVPYLSAFQDVVLNFTSGGDTGIASFLEWWELSGQRKSVILPGNQDAVRILTIHKSKGLEFTVVILPFISWNLDHMPFQQPLLWVKPDEPPFSDLGVVPVKCSKELANTIFADYYREEKYSVHLDNLNLLYVAFTRAKDVLIGFSELSSRNGNIGGLLKETLMCDSEIQGLKPCEYYDAGTNVFDYGSLAGKERTGQLNADILSRRYAVNKLPATLKLKLHAENYFSPSAENVRKKISYGKIMHEVFEGINSVHDVKTSVRKLVLEGKIPEAEAGFIERRIQILLSDPVVSEWFEPGTKVMKETGIILTSGNIRRPDRVIIKNNSVAIIDFKFGEENEEHIKQIELYRSLLIDMGHHDTRAYVWYVDKNKIVKA